MKKLALIIAGAVVVFGLLAAAEVVHHNNLKIQAQKAQNAAENLAIVKKVDAENEARLQSDVDSYKAQLATDRQTLCTFISQHVKGVTLPTQCTQ